MNILNEVENKQITNKVINFKSGDKICVNFKIIDSNIKKKNYNFEGYVIAIRNKGLNLTCVLRKESLGESIEKTFFFHSPSINWIKLIKKGNTKKSKLYCLKKIK